MARIFQRPSTAPKQEHRCGGGPVPVSEITLKRYAEDLAVLCSRGPNEVPVHADFVGLQLDVGGENAIEVPVHADFVGLQLDVGGENAIEVHVPPYEERLRIVLRHRKDVTG